MAVFNREGCKTEYRYITGEHGRPLKLMILRPEQGNGEKEAPGMLWLHGGGYFLGFPEMAFMTRARDAVAECGAVVVCPAYRLSVFAPYPAALKDSYRALLYMKDHAEELGIREDQLMVGGESAGGGLTAEPFYCETLSYVEKLKAAGVPAGVDVYPGGYHAFDLMEPDSAAAKQAAARFIEEFRYAAGHYSAPQR